MRRAWNLSARGWGRVIVVTLSGTFLCVSAALFVDSFTFSQLDEAARFRAVLVDILLPIALAAPMLSFLMMKLRELAIAKHELTILASTDSLTQVLNRGAFTLIVDTYLAKVRASQLLESGALLVVDVDHFKKINDRFGHARGDAALRLIAHSIKASVRDVDLVGRIGGEEFGVFLPSSSRNDALGIAERIRSSIAAVDFRPQGTSVPLSVSVGGTSFVCHVAFDELFHHADQRLYEAKEQGRNRVKMLAMTAG
ncbi:GGDEF domain-containing protein [Devosia sp. SL43]|uniref:GGDEF domain-containing protein n=1 Tax=Devosia sp. SL43 TaxID=2806348 RepID=UPI001F24DFD8|nr:GGDEF domain-containing protein [Devosia sp. SL43]UJW85574.1 GGDEF domain-containing protein [Devosia sp. SL43]